MLLAIGQADLPDGLYLIELQQVIALPDGSAFEKYGIREAPGKVYEEGHALSDRDTND